MIAGIFETTPDKADIFEVEFKFKNSLSSSDHVFSYFDGNEIKELDFKSLQSGEWILIGDTSDALKYLM